MAVGTQGLVLTIECKKTDGDDYVFLQPTPASTGLGRDARVICTQPDIVEMSHKLRPVHFWWRGLVPESYQAEFCVLRKEKGLLERDAKLLLRATLAYANLTTNSPGLAYRPLLPMLVTNAKLFVMHYPAGAVSLESGTLESRDKARLEAVSFVRFTKSFFSSRTQDLGTHTVLVVQARAFEQCLELLSGDLPQYRPDDLAHATRSPYE